MLSDNIDTNPRHRCLQRSLYLAPLFLLCITRWLVLCDQLETTEQSETVRLRFSHEMDECNILKIGNHICRLKISKSTIWRLSLCGQLISLHSVESVGLSKDTKRRWKSNYQGPNHDSHWQLCKWNYNNLVISRGCKLQFQDVFRCYKFQTFTDIFSVSELCQKRNQYFHILRKTTNSG